MAVAVAVDTATAPRAGAATGDRPARALTVVSVLIGLTFLAPFGYLLARVVGVDGMVGELGESSTLVPLRSTLTLAVAVSVASAVVGTALAWLTTRTDLPMRRLWAVAAALPLIYPSFIGAAARHSKSTVSARMPRSGCAFSGFRS